MNRDFYHFGEGRPAVHSVAFGDKPNHPFPLSKPCWISELIAAKMACPIPWACRPPPTNWVRAFSGTNVISWFGYPPRMSSAASLLKVKKEVC